MNVIIDNIFDDNENMDDLSSLVIVNSSFNGDSILLLLLLSKMSVL